MAYADIVKDRSKLRRLIMTCNQVSDIAYFPEGKNGMDIIQEAQEQLVDNVKRYARQKATASDAK
jgi:replicative DNA helicase